MAIYKPVHLLFWVSPDDFDRTAQLHAEDAADPSQGPYFYLGRFDDAARKGLEYHVRQAGGVFSPDLVDAIVDWYTACHLVHGCFQAAEFPYPKNELAARLADLDRYGYHVRVEQRLAANA